MVKNQVLVIIVTYNAKKWIDNCLNSLKTSSIPVDVFIVDNNSSDGTVEYLYENYKNTKLVESEANLGFGKANNIGIEYALANDYEYVYLLNQDAYVFENTIQELINVFEVSNEFGILSPLQLNSGCTKFDQNFALCCPREMLSDAFCKDIAIVYETKFVMAAHWFLARSCLRSIGGFSPSFEHYGEDHNYLHRALFKDFKIGIVPTALAVHDREFRVQSKEAALHKKYIKAIVEISNINNKLWYHLLVQPVHLLALSLRYKSLNLFFKVFRLLFKYPFFLSNRKQSKKNAFV
jgi:N-acetylglucosaminyl-diphospho-decaprenol L-rhamnosyltransferase